MTVGLPIKGHINKWKTSWGPLGALDRGSRFHRSIMMNVSPNATLSNSRNAHVTLSIIRNDHVAVHYEYEALDGGSQCQLSILRNNNVALSNIKKRSCPPVKSKKLSCPMSLSLENPCCMSLSPKKAYVAMLILGVKSHRLCEREIVICMNDRPRPSLSLGL